MNIVTANSIKQHGVSVLEEQIKLGPVHVFKHNRPLFVVISEKEYLSLTTKPSGLFALLEKKTPGTRSKQDIDQQLKNERDGWHNENLS